MQMGNSFGKVSFIEESEQLSKSLRIFSLSKHLNTSPVFTSTNLPTRIQSREAHEEMMGKSFPTGGPHHELAQHRFNPSKCTHSHEHAHRELKLNHDFHNHELVQPYSIPILGNDSDLKVFLRRLTPMIQFAK